MFFAKSRIRVPGMSILLMGLLAVVLSVGDVSAREKKGKADAGEVKDPVQAEYEKLLQMDENAMNAVEKILKEADAFAEKGAPTPESVVQANLEEKLRPVEKAYKDFLEKHPEHVEGHLALGSFYSELGDEESAIPVWEKARELAPNNPAPWNNLANIYGHIGPVRKAFNYYERAIELNPKEPVYFQNLATTTYLFRKDAKEIYRITETEVFDKALDLYRKAIALDPTNMVLRTDLAQSYYGIKPVRTEEALAAWNDALKLAKSDAERQGLYIHIARVQIMSGLLDEGEENLARVTLPELDDLKTRLTKVLTTKRAEGKNEPEKEEPAATAESASR